MTRNRTVFGGVCSEFGTRRRKETRKFAESGLARHMLYNRCMKTKSNSSEIIKRLTADTGSVMMEYVVLLAFIVVGMAAISYQGVYDYSTRQFGFLGSQIVVFYQQLQAGMSLPVP